MYIQLPLWYDSSINGEGVEVYHYGVRYNDGKVFGVFPDTIDQAREELVWANGQAAVGDEYSETFRDAHIVIAYDEDFQWTEYHDGDEEAGL